MSRVRVIQTVKLPDAQTIPEAPSEEHREKWAEGLRLLRKRAKEWEGEQRLFYLDRPIAFRKTPLTKQSFNDKGLTKGILD